MLNRLFFYLKYLSNPPWDTGVSPPELLEFIRLHPAGRALDLGCGTGTNALTLANAGWEVTAVDFVSRAIDIARRKAAQVGANIDFRVQNVTRLAHIAGPFDLVLDIGCFHSLPQQERRGYLIQLTSLLAPQGVYLLYAFLRETGEVSSAGSPGLATADLHALTTRLNLVERKDGLERNTIPSAWFTFQPHTRQDPLPSHGKPSSR